MTISKIAKSAASRYRQASSEFYRVRWDNDSETYQDEVDESELRILEDGKLLATCNDVSVEYELLGPPTKNGLGEDPVGPLDPLDPDHVDWYVKDAFGVGIDVQRAKDEEGSASVLQS